MQLSSFWSNDSETNKIELLVKWYDERGVGCSAVSFNSLINPSSYKAANKQSCLFNSFHLRKIDIIVA